MTAPFDTPLEPSVFVSAVAHELKNPLSAIYAYSDLLLETHVGDGLTEKQREVAARIRQTAAKAADLVKNYQFLSLHTEASDTQGQCDLRAITNSVIETYWRESKSISLSIEVGDTPLLVGGTSTQVERIVSNLFSNAMKYTPQNGNITVMAKPAGSTVIFSVHNSGSFIPADELASIFTRYARGKNAKAHNPGAGLGLFIVGTICSTIGATLNVESSQEGGTTFFVKLPLVETTD